MKCVDTILKNSNKRYFFWEDFKQKDFLFNRYIFEIAGIELGIKKASIFYVDKKEIPYYIAALKNHDYFYELSDFSYLIKDGIAKRVNDSVKEGCCFLYFSKNREICQRLKYLDYYQKFDEIDEPSGMNSVDIFFEISNILGYPECCSKFLLSCQENKDYENLFVVVKPYQNEVIYKLLALKNTSRILHQLNNFDDPYPTIFNFFVCKYDCKNTLSIANKLLDHIRKKYPSEYESLVNDLKIPMIFFPSYGAICFSNLVKKGERIYYSSCFFRKEVMQHNLSKKRINDFNKRLMMFLDGDSFQIEDEKILIYKNEHLVYSMKRGHQYDGLFIEFK